MAAKPPPGLMGDAWPGRIIVWAVAPMGLGADEPAEGIEGVAEVMDAPADVLGQEAQVGKD